MKILDKPVFASCMLHVHLRACNLHIPSATPDVENKIYLLLLEEDWLLGFTVP